MSDGKRAPQVQDELCRVSDAVGLLSDLRMELNTRLGCVLVPEAPPETNPAVEAEPLVELLVPLAGELRLLAERVARECVELRSVLGRLEL